MKESPFELVWDLVAGRVTAEQLLLALGTPDGPALALALMQDAAERKSENDFEAAMCLCFRFGPVPMHKDLLCKLADASWHHSHEDIVSCLDRLRDPSTIDTLYRATQWLPAYMAWDDENRALALKAIRAIAKLPGKQADERLAELARSSHPLMSALAQRKLDERRATAQSKPS